MIIILNSNARIRWNIHLNGIMVVYGGLWPRLTPLLTARQGKDGILVTMSSFYVNVRICCNDDGCQWVWREPEVAKSVMPPHRSPLSPLHLSQTRSHSVRSLSLSPIINHSSLVGTRRRSDECRPSPLVFASLITWPHVTNEHRSTHRSVKCNDKLSQWVWKPQEAKEHVSCYDIRWIDKWLLRVHLKDSALRQVEIESNFNNST